MSTLDSKILQLSNDIYQRSNVLDQYVDGSITCYSLLLNDRLFQNIASIFIQSTPYTMERQYEIDTVSTLYYKTPQFWYMILLMNGIHAIDYLKVKEPLYIPPSDLTKNYFADALTTLQKTTPTTNEPDLSSIMDLNFGISKGDVDTMWVMTLVMEELA